MKRPNVVFVLTDDQGYGDLGCHGNPYVKTPNIDAFYQQSVRCTDYHVGPTCAPARAGIMTGHYANSTGVWHTVGGRSLLRKNEWSVASAFSENGYATGIFGKWHLGDNYPYRAMDRGFQTAVVHGGGGITQAPDYWGNDYFDDTYSVNGVPTPFHGYCTDVFFSQAMQFIETHHEEPFFCMITPNAPHSPHNVPEQYHALYADADIPTQRAKMYGMVTNIDENFGKLYAQLETLDLLDHTILIFMTDNGTAFGASLDAQDFVTDGYNYGMRGKKNSEYEGGHRVPFFIRCPQLQIGGGKDMASLCANVDLMPTLMELCDLPNTKEVPFDGMSIAAYLVDCARTIPARVLVTDSQRVPTPIKWRKSATMCGHYRLINGTELYEVQTDPEQRNDIAQSNPTLVQSLREEYETWWEQVTNGHEIEIPIYVTKDEVYLSSHDLRGDVEDCVYSQALIRQADVGYSYWEIYLPEDGVYHFDVRRWPKSHPRALKAGIPVGESDIIWNQAETEEHESYLGGTPIDIVKTTLIIAEQRYELPVGDDDISTEFTVALKQGATHLYAIFTDREQVERSAYFVYANQVE